MLELTRRMKAIFCGNLDYDARQSDLERLFRRYGRIDRVDMKSGLLGMSMLFLVGYAPLHFFLWHISSIIFFMSFFHKNQPDPPWNCHPSFPETPLP